MTSAAAVSNYREYNNLSSTSSSTRYDEVDGETDAFFKNYSVLDTIGSGVYSDVLKCERRDTGKLYACKRLHEKCWSSRQVRRSAEVSSARLLPRHSNVLRLLEYFVNKSCGRVVLVFDLMDSDLLALIRDQEQLLPDSRIRPIMFQILSGLAHIHKHKVIHCDLKPENILLSSSHEIVKIADFGCSKRMVDTLPHDQIYVVTRWYRGPEGILTNGFYGLKIDIWSVGCIFYELLSLRPLFPGVNAVDQIDKIHSTIGPPPPNVLEYFCRCNDEEMRTPPMSIARGRRTNEISEMLSPFLRDKLADDDGFNSWEDSETLGGQENGLDFLLEKVIRNDECYYLRAKALLKDLLQYDPNWRPTANDALNYAYFKSPKSLSGGTRRPTSSY